MHIKNTGGTVKAKPVFHWDPQMMEISEMWKNCQRSANKEWNQLKREKLFIVKEAKRSWRFEEYIDIWHGEWNLEFFLLILGLSLVQYFLALFHVLPFRMAMYVLCDCMLEVCDLFFVNLTGSYNNRLPWVSDETLNYSLLNIVEPVIDHGNF